VYFWINEGKWGRTDLNTIASPGREPKESLAAVIAGKLDADPHFSVRRLAQSLGIAASKVCQFLTEVLGMKCRHLRWVPHRLTLAQKLMNSELAQSSGGVPGNLGKGTRKSTNVQFIRMPVYGQNRLHQPFLFF
jgi:hypothetical protein